SGQAVTAESRARRRPATVPRACPESWGNRMTWQLSSSFGDCCPRCHAICERERRTIPLTSTGALRYGVATCVGSVAGFARLRNPVSADGRGASVVEGRDGRGLAEGGHEILGELPQRDVPV